MKGQLEAAVSSLGFAKLSIFNPPILERKNTGRTGELIGLKVIRFLNHLGLFPSQKPMPTKTLAQALINSAKATENGVHIYKGDDIWKCASNRKARD